MDMELKLGARIASLRHAQGMTQEALARAVGVSGAAVSKWETDASCPDIALLCPLARALGTNVDTLLAFEPSVGRAQIGEIVAEIVRLARAGDEHGAKAAIAQALHAYPSSGDLKLNLAAVMSVLQMTFERDHWQRERRALYEAVYQSGTDAQRQAAAGALAGIALAEDRLEDAQRYLDAIPEHHEETILQRVRLHQRRGETDEARAAVQKKLYAALSQANTCLQMIMETTDDASVHSAAIEGLRALERVFGVGGGYSAGLAMQQHLAAGQKEEALACLTALIDAMTAPPMIPNPMLFAPTIEAGRRPNAAPRELREAALRGLRADAELAPLRGEQAYEAAVCRLRESLKKDE